MDDTRDGCKDKDEDDLYTDDINEILRKPIDKSQLTREQRYRIGGLEYRAIDFLSKMIPIWYLSVNLIGSLALRIYIASSSYAQQVLETSNPTPMDPWLFSFFVCISSFDNLGLSVLDASMVPFLNAPAPLLISAFMILLGNTGYPISLRAAIWCMHKLTPNEHTRKTLRYLLEHPRRCYTNLFPSTQTWWLVIVVVVFNVVMTTVFLATNFWLPVLDGVSWPSRVLDGFFQGVSTRNAGFVVVNLLQVNPGTQICYIIFMYISVYPLAISIRNSNVYQERELGIYSHTRQDDEEQGLGTIKLRRKPTISSVMTSSRKLISKRPSFYVMQQLQRQLAQEIVWLILGVFFICVIEAESIMSPSPITALTVLYECASAFGTAGSSTGFPGVSTSQSAQYHTLSKLILIALMIRGRHRGLPSAIDRAVQLPSEELDEMDNKEQQLKQYHVDILASRELSTSDLSMSTSRWHMRTSNSHRSIL
ncbi:cation transporter [Lichtheimia hyalospora FSU 10163]|nr:cation transporter [Lichtheimia hyalospora FSU 10163]